MFAMDFKISKIFQEMRISNKLLVVFDTFVSSSSSP